MQSKDARIADAGGSFVRLLVLPFLAVAAMAQAPSTTVWYCHRFPSMVGPYNLQAIRAGASEACADTVLARRIESRTLRDVMIMFDLSFWKRCERRVIS